MTKTITLAYCYFQTTTPFILVIFSFNQWHGKEQLVQVWDKMHEPIPFGHGLNMEFHPDGQTRPSQSRFCISIHQVLKPIQYDPNGPQTCWIWYYSVVGSQLGIINSSQCKTRPHVQNQNFPKLAKSEIHRRPNQVPCLFQINAKDQDKVVRGASKLTQQPHMSPNVQPQACFESPNILKQTFNSFPPNHPHTFPINSGRCPLHSPRLKSPKIFVEHSSWNFKNRVSIFYFQSVLTPNNHPETFTNIHSNFPKP